MNGFIRFWLGLFMVVSINYSDRIGANTVTVLSVIGAVLMVWGVRAMYRQVENQV